MGARLHFAFEHTELVVEVRRVEVQRGSDDERGWLIEIVAVGVYAPVESGHEPNETGRRNVAHRRRLG